MERKLGVRSNEFQAPAELRFSGIFAVFVYEMDRMGPVIQGVAHHEFVTDISRQIPANSQMMGIKTIIEYTPGYPAGFFRFGSEKGFISILDCLDIHIQTVQDTDVTPFDTGAYASRQSFVTGTVVKDCANLLKKKILDYAKELLPEETRKLRLDHGWIMAGKDPAISLGNLALESYYSLGNSSVITAEVSEQVKKNTIATGCCFAEVEVDIKLGKIKILHIINVHDSGKLINPKLAEMQVQGGMSMGMGYGLSEQLILDEKTGRPLNGTLLDYKLMTMMDTPDIKADFVELDDPIGPFGNKALGEPPAIPGAPAIRNAVLHATGVAFNENPLTPQRLIDGFMKAGLI